MIEKLIKNADKKLSVLFIGGAAVVGWLGLRTSSNLMEQVALTAFLGGAVYLCLNWFMLPAREAFTELDWGGNGALVWDSTYIILIGSMLLAYRESSRSVLLLILGAAAAGFLALSILSARIGRQRRIIYLAEIMILFLLLSGSAYYQYPSIIGSDSWVHSYWISRVVHGGRLGSFLGGYSSFTLFFTLIGSFLLLADISVKSGMFLTTTALGISIIFIYLTGKRFFGEKIGLLSALVLAVSTFYIQQGVQIIPQSLGVVFLVIITFFLTDLVGHEEGNIFKEIMWNTLLLVFLLVIVLTHTISSFVALVILATFFVISIAKLMGRHQRNEVNAGVYKTCLSVSFFYGVFLIGYWMYSSDFWGFAVKSTVWAFSVSYLTPPTTTLREAFGQALFSWLPMYIIVLFALIAGLYAIRERIPLVPLIYGWGTVIFTGLATFLQMSAFLPGRWFSFIDVFLVMSVGFIIPFLISVFRQRFLRMLWAFAIVAFIGIVGLTNYQANVKNVFPWTPYPTQGFTEAEMVAPETVFPKMKNNDWPYGDLYYDKLGLDNGSDILAGRRALSGLFLLRKSVKNEAYFSTVGTSGHYDVFKWGPKQQAVMAGYDKVYSNKDVCGYWGSKS